MIMNNSVVVAQEDEVGGRRVMLLELLELHLCQCGCHRGICEEGGVCQRAWGLISTLASRWFCCRADTETLSCGDCGASGAGDHAADQSRLCSSNAWCCEALREAGAHEESPLLKRADPSFPRPQAGFSGAMIRCNHGMWRQVSLWTRRQLLDARGDTAMQESANQSHGQVEVISARCTITKGC